jgi:hypothetical protein
MRNGKKILYLPLVIALVFTLAFFVHSKTKAQTGNFDVTISPVFFDLSANPGGRVSDRIRIRNNTTSPININVEVQRMTGDDEGALTLTPEDPENTISWVKIQDRTITAPPLEFVDVPFTIEIPNSAAYGYYYAVNFTNSDATVDGTGAAISGAAAVPILLNVRKEGAVAEAKLAHFSPVSFINEYLPVDFKVQIENSGNVHIRPRGNIFISSGGKDDLAILEVNENVGNIIPNTKREFITSWSDGFIVREPVIEDGQVKLDEDGNPETSLKINWDKLTSFRIGKYTANLLLVYDNGERDVTIEDSKTFWVIPYKFIIGTIVGLILFVLLVRFMLKRYIQRELRKRGRR